MYDKYVKRFFDVLFAVVALPFLGILTLIIYVWIKTDDGGPVFYNADRLGKNGFPFTMFKFRTMKVNAADIRNPDGSTFSGKNDPRLTKAGKFLRVTSLDELPQAVNVLLGQMSFVGPRPDLVDQKSMYSAYYDKWERRVSVLPGITGYSQAFFRNTAEFAERLEQDLFYVDQIGLFLDVRIIFQTVISVISRRGVYRNDKTKGHGSK